MTGFADGDVVRFLDDATDILVRVAGRWVCNRGTSHPHGHSDEEVAVDLASGLAVRLIEATP